MANTYFWNMFTILWFYRIEQILQKQKFEKLREKVAKNYQKKLFATV